MAVDDSRLWLGRWCSFSRTRIRPRRRALLHTSRSFFCDTLYFLSGSPSLCGKCRSPASLSPSLVSTGAETAERKRWALSPPDGAVVGLGAAAATSTTVTTTTAMTMTTKTTAATSPSWGTHEQSSTKSPTTLKSLLNGRSLSGPLLLNADHIIWREQQCLKMRDQLWNLTA